MLFAVVLSDDSLAQAHSCVVSGGRDMKGVYDQQISKHKPLQGVGRLRATGLCRPECRWVRRTWNTKGTEGGKAKVQVRTSSRKWKKPWRKKVLGKGTVSKDGLFLCYCSKCDCSEAASSVMDAMAPSISVSRQCWSAGDRNCLWGGMAAAGNEKGHPPACSFKSAVLVFARMLLCTTAQR